MIATLIATTLSFLLFSTGDVPAGAQSAGVSEQALRAFIDQTDREWPDEPYQQATTVESLTLLANAVSSLAQQKGILVRLADDVAQLRANIRDYRAGSPNDDRQSARLRRTLVHAGGLIQRLVAEANRERRPNDPALRTLRRAADSVDIDRSLRRQSEVIERFFGQAAGILRRLDSSAGASMGGVRWTIA